MSRFIDKLIARHLEPERNVKPLLTNVPQAVPGEVTPLKEEEENDPGDTPEAVRTPRRPASTEVRENDNNVWEDPGDIRRIEVRDRGEEEFRPVNAARKVEVRKEADGTEPEGAEKLREVVERTVENVKHRVEYIENRVKYVEKEKVGVGMDAVRSVSQPAPMEEPVLRDLGRETRMEQTGAGKERTVTPLPGIIQHNNIFNAALVQASPAAEVRQTVNVSIGRIEIRAVTAPAAVKAQPVKKTTKVMGLDQYLEQRNPANR